GINLGGPESGQGLHPASFGNPQRFGGSDLMPRISDHGGEFNGELQQVMLSSLNFEIGWMARELGFHRRNIYEVVIVGNSTMRDILFGVDVQSIGEKPYKSLVEHEVLRGERETTAIHTTAKELGLRVFPRAHIYGGPIIASHVGADVTADLLAIGMDEQDEVVMLLDVGTNTEVVVGNRHRIMAASCPAGPAFEGGEVMYGMPGYVGAVESVKLTEDSCECNTIDEADAQGICGSGLIDLLAELRRTEKMNRLGVFADGSQAFTFLPEKEMTLSRADISALAQAKSANFCGQFIVLRNYGVPIEDISKLYLAGGFANYVNAQNAVNIGFVANFPQDKIMKAGNASLEGATVMLLNTDMREVAENMTRNVEHIELETTPDFFEVFVEGCMFDPMTTAIQ
ncbi:MAG: ASKHA domain-containing protein, partial [Chloroflexi bacterium]|nr:ASKHA domain-containing protein [Chloroflexota bacterium]